MKKQNQKNKSRAAAKNPRARVITVTVAILLIAVAAITVLSKQLNGANASPSQTAGSEAPKYVTVKVAGQDVQVDPQTGQVKPLTPEEAKHLADGLKPMFNRSTEGLKPVRHADGSLSMDLQGRFQNVAVARKNADGTVEQSCVDNPEAAANFFGIDPQLVGVEPVKGGPSKPMRPPARKNAQ
jgi:hypothetical protein